jgi:hypothetical protein
MIGKCLFLFPTCGVSNNFFIPRLTVFSSKQRTLFANIVFLLNITEIMCSGDPCVHCFSWGCTDDTCAQLKETHMCVFPLGAPLMTLQGLCPDTALGRVKTTATNKFHSRRLKTPLFVSLVRTKINFF